MKKIEIIIREVNCDNFFEELEDKTVTSMNLIPDIEDSDNALIYYLDSAWLKSRDYFLKERNNVPFRPIRRDHEETSKD